MKNISADLILLPGGQLSGGRSISINEDGVITEIGADTGDVATERFSGILCPGFINAHCHLELSHLDKKINPGTGLPGFIEQIVMSRGDGTEAEILKGAERADKMMWNNGIQGVGDICNTRNTIPVKKSSAIRYHSFLEVFDLAPQKTSQVYDDGIALYEEFRKNEMSCSLVPHAPYSVTPDLLKLLADENRKHPGSSPWAIHMLESGSENQLFSSKSGELFNSFNRFGLDYLWISEDCHGTVDYLINSIPSVNHVLLVHNTYMNENDLSECRSGTDPDQLYLCLCPGANEFIEQRVPDIAMFDAHNLKMVIGTDSLASNHMLSVSEELNCIRKHYPQLDTGKLLMWATQCGAEFFKWDDLGTFEPGKAPGVVLVSESDEKRLSVERIL